MRTSKQKEEYPFALINQANGNGKHNCQSIIAEIFIIYLNFDNKKFDSKTFIKIKGNGRAKGLFYCVQRWIDMGYLMMSNFSN